MRILIWSPSVSLGGGGRLLLNLSKAIARQDDIELVRMVVPAKTGLREILTSDNHSNIEVVYAKEDSTLESSSPFLKDCHVVYYFWPHGLSCYHIDRPTICTFHDTTILDYVPPFTLGSQIKQYWEESQLWLQRCTSVVAPSNYVKSRLSSLFGYDDASVIHHAILLENTLTSKDNGVANVPTNYFVYPANTSPHKNHYNLLLAYSKFKYRKQYPLVLFGYLTDLLRHQPPNWPETASLPTLVSLIKRIGLEIDKDIYPMGFIDDSAIAPTITNAKALIMASHSEGGGSYPVEEALRMGVPVLCSDIPVMREHLAGRTAKIAWFDPTSPDSICHALEDMVHSYDAYKESTILGISDSSETWDDIAKKYIHEFRVAFLKYYANENITEQKSDLILQSQGTPFSSVQLSGTHIGIFLMYPGRVSMDGEGIGRFIVRLCEGMLQKDDVHIHITTNSENRNEVEKIFMNQVKVYARRITIHSAPNIDWVNMHVPVQGWIVPYVGLELALRLKKPFMICLHDLIHRHFPQMYYNRYPDFFKNIDRISEQMVRNAAFVVFSSEFIRMNEGLKFLNLPAEQTRVVRLAPPTEEYNTFNVRAENEFRQKYNLFGPYITFPSAIRLHKNHDRLIEAFIKFKQKANRKQSKLQLVFTDVHTPGPKSAEITSLLNGCKDREVKDSIRFLGRLSSQDIPSLYKYALGTIVPTLFEGSCPFPILESLIMGTPVAISNIEVAREVILNMEPFITFDPHSVEEIEQAIGRLWSQPVMLAWRQRAAVGQALQRTWTDVANEYYGIFTGMITES